VVLDSIMAADQSFLPLFHPDGTTSQSMQLVVASGELESTIRLDRLTARASLVTDSTQDNESAKR